MRTQHSHLQKSSLVPHYLSTIHLFIQQTPFEHLYVLGSVQSAEDTEAAMELTS